MALRMVRVAVVGTPNSVLSGSAKGVGKSCICNRFIHPENYCEEHSSEISAEDWEGSVVCSEHFIYWGAATKFNVQTGRVRYQLVEFTEFVHKDTGLVFPFEADYIGRACEPIKSLGKVSYLPPSQLQQENTSSKSYSNLPSEESSSSKSIRLRSKASLSTTRSILEEGISTVSGYVCVFDPTVPEENGQFQRQIEFLRHLLDEISKLKKPFVVACTKCDHTEVTKEKISRGRSLLLTERKRKNIIFIESSARENVNVDEIFFALVVSMNKKKNLGPSLIRRNTSSLIDVSTYREVEWQKKKQLKLARSNFKLLLANKVTRFDTYWEETKPQLEKELEYQRLVALEGDQIVRKMFCYRLMEVKLLEVTQKYEQGHSVPPVTNGKDSSVNIEDKMKFSQTVLKEAVASHPDLDVSSLYEFVQPQKDDRLSSSSPPPPQVTITTTSPTTTTATAPRHTGEDGQDRSSQVENGDMNGDVSHKPTSSSNLTRSMEEEIELDRGDSKSWNPFQQRSKSYIFSRSKKVKTTTTTVQTGKSESKELAAGEFWTLPRGKKKSRKKDKVVDKVAVPVGPEQRKMSDTQLSFEDNGQYTEENPPPLPPRPQELPPIQKRHMGQQSKGNHNDEFSESSTSHGPQSSNSVKLQNRSSSCGCLLDDGKDEPDQSTLDFTPENACPYEVPRALMTTTLSRGSEGLDLVDKRDGGTCATAIGRTALHSSFRSDITSLPGETIGLRSHSGGDRSGEAFLTQRERPTRDHFLHPPTRLRTHKRGGSYDQSLQVIMNQEATPPSDMPRPSFTSYTQPSSQPIVVSSTQATLHWPTDTQGAMVSPNSDYNPVKNYNGRFDEKRRNIPISSTFRIKKVSDTPASPLVATNLHSRQSSLPDFFVTDHKPVPPERFTEYLAHNMTSTGLDEMHLSGEYVGKFHPRAEPLTPNPPPVCRSRSGTSLEHLSSSDLRQSTSKSSSEEREYAVIVHSAKNGDANVDIPDQQDSEWPTQGEKMSHGLSEDCLYEQIDEEMVKNIVGRRGVPLLSSSFPKPLFPHDFNPDRETVQQIQQWHLKFLHFYQHWLRGLDKIVENSISRQTIENVLTSDNSASEQHLSGNSLGQSSVSPPLVNNPPIPVNLQSSNPSISSISDQPALQTKDTPKPPSSDPPKFPSSDQTAFSSMDPPKPPSSDPTAFSSMDPPKPPSSDPPKAPSSDPTAFSSMDPPKPPSSDPPSATLHTKREISAVTVYVSLQNKPGVQKRTESQSTQSQCSSMGRTSPVLLRKPARSESRTAIRLPRRDRMSVDSILDSSVEDTYDRLSGYHPQVMTSVPNIPESLYSKKSSLV